MKKQWYKNWLNKFYINCVRKPIIIDKVLIIADIICDKTIICIRN